MPAILKCLFADNPLCEASAIWAARYPVRYADRK